MAIACLAGMRFIFEPFVPPNFFTTLFRIEASHRDSGAETRFTPPVFRVEREQTRIEIREARAARRARAPRRKDSHCARSLRRSFAPVLVFDRDMNDSLTEFERLRQRLAQLTLAARCDLERCNRQLERVLFETIEPRPLVRRQQFAIDSQMRIALLCSPRGEIGVIALTRDDERCEQCDRF